MKSGWFVLVMLGCGADEPPVDELASNGPQTLVFGRASGNAMDTLVVRRDVAVAGDRVENVDFFAAGVPTVWTTVFIDNFVPNAIVRSDPGISPEAAPMT